MAKIVNSNNFVLTTTAQNNIHIAAANCGVDEVLIGGVIKKRLSNIVPVYDENEESLLFLYNLTLDKVEMPN